MRFIEEALFRHGLQRKVMATTPHWLAASYLVETTDLVTALSESMGGGGSTSTAASPCACCRSEWAEFSWRLYWHRSPSDARPAHRWIRTKFEEIGRDSSRRRLLAR